MSGNNTYWQIHCGFPLKNKSITVELPPDIEFKLNVLASEKGVFPEKLAETIIKDYININCKNKTFEKYFK